MLVGQTKILSARTAVLLFLFSFAILSATGFYATAKFQDVQALALGSDRILEARDHRIAQVIRVNFKRRRLGWSPSSGFSADLIHAVLEAEDRRFYQHRGVDAMALARALRADLLGRRVQGASTISMQVGDLIQPAVLNGDRNIVKGSLLHKLAQIWRGFWLDRRWSKDEILTAYLNLIHLRGEYQGVPALSYAFFGKDPHFLDREESVAVATMISSPNQGVAPLQKKSCALLNKLNGAPTDCARLDTLVAQILKRPASMPTPPDFAPHLARRLFQFRKDTALIHSYLDLDLQKNVAAILQRHVNNLKDKHVNDAAAIVIDNASGEVLAYVGAVASSDTPYVDGVTAARQAGSALKPFIYGRGFDQRLFTAASIFLDEGTAIAWDGGVYRPTNYDRQFNGPVSVREALGSSLNVPAVKALITIGLGAGYQVLHDLGFTELRDPDFYGVSMALGSVDIHLEELANAYRTFANAGEWSELKFSDADASHPRRVFSAEASYIIASILSDPNARTIGFGWDSPLETPFWTAVKTGTSKDYRDNWCAGFSSKYTVAVWDGNFDASQMKGVSGVSGAAPSWFDIMAELHRREPSHAPAVPKDLVRREIRHAWSNSTREEYFIRDTEPANDVIEEAPDRQAKFIFPSEGSVLVKDPKIDPKKVGVFVRFKGQLPSKTVLRMDGTTLGAAESPFRIDQIRAGKHELALLGPGGETLTAIHFLVKGY